MPIIVLTMATVSSRISRTPKVSKGCVLHHYPEVLNNDSKVLFECG